MKKNKLILIKKLKLDDLPADSIRIVLNGERMKTKNEFIDEIGTAFTFPTPCRDNLDGFLDWIRDLGWGPFENCKKINLIITNKQQLLSAEPEGIKLCIELFVDCILPYWEEEVLIDTVGGECKEFNLYLVDDIK